MAFAMATLNPPVIPTNQDQEWYQASMAISGLILLLTGVPGRCSWTLYRKFKDGKRILNPQYQNKVDTTPIAANEKNAKQG